MALLFHNHGQLDNDSMDTFCRRPQSPAHGLYDRRHSLHDSLAGCDERCEESCKPHFCAVPYHRLGLASSSTGFPPITVHRNSGQETVCIDGAIRISCCPSHSPGAEPFSRTSCASPTGRAALAPWDFGHCSWRSRYSTIPLSEPVIGNLHPPPSTPRRASSSPANPCLLQWLRRRDRATGAVGRKESEPWAGEFQSGNVLFKWGPRLARPSSSMLDSLSMFPSRYFVTSNQEHAPPPGGPIETPSDTLPRGWRGEVGDESRRIFIFFAMTS
jgi:hypothetical protein